MRAARADADDTTTSLTVAEQPVSPLHTSSAKEVVAVGQFSGRVFRENNIQ